MADYDAGRAFVAILPSTRGFAQRLKRDMAGIQTDVAIPVRPELDRRQLSGLQAALKSLPAVVLTPDSSPVDREIAALRERIEHVDAAIGVKLSDAEAFREIQAIRGELDRLGRESPEIPVRVDAGAASAALAEITQESVKLDGREARLRVAADTSRATAPMAAVGAQADRLDGRRITMQTAVDIGRSMAELATLLYAVNQFANKDYSFSVRADTASAVAGVTMLIARVMALGGLAGVLGGLGGALAGLGAAGAVAGAGLAATLLASLGVGKALTALNAQQDAAGQTAAQAAKQEQAHAAAVTAAYDRVQETSSKVGQARADSARNVARAEADAERSVDAARRQAASSIASAMSAKEAADRRLERSTRDLRTAQSELTSAWEAGRRSLQDLQDQLDGSLIDQRQAALDLKDARKQLDQAMASGDGDAIERAQIGYDRARESVDQLGKRVQRLQVDNSAAQKAGVEGTDQYRSALDRVRSAEDQRADAVRSAGQAADAVDKARADGLRSIQEAERAGQQRVDDAREQGARQVDAAVNAAADAQRALAQTLAQTGDAGESAALKTQAAFAKLSPEAAGFVRFIAGTVQPTLERLSGVASAQLFPPLMLGMQALLAQEPAISGMVGTLAGAVGGALQFVLTQLASPQWMGFFGLLAGASTTILPPLAALLMQAAWAGAMLLAALLPLAPAGMALASEVIGLVVALTPFLVQLLSGLIPGATMFLAALTPLGPVLGALQPILLVLAQALAVVLGAFLRALAPVLVALTPLIQALAVQIASGLVASIQAATPWLVGIATWMSQNPGLVMGVVGAVGTLLSFLKPLAFVAGLVVGALHNFLIISVVRSLLAGLGLEGSLAGTLLLRLLSPINLIKLALPIVGRLFTVLARVLVSSLGPVGMLITILGYLFTTNEQFRGAVLGLVGVLGQLVGQVLASLMPAVNALMPVINMAAGVFAGIASGLATALVPVVQALAAVLQWLSPIIAPLLGLIIGVRAAMMLWAAAQWLLNIAMSANPIGLIVLAIAALVGGVVWAYQNVGWFRDAVNALWSGLQVAFSAIGAAWDAVVFAMQWAWANILSPVFDAIGLVVRILIAVILTVFIAPLMLAWQALMAGMEWAWQNILLPVWNAIMAVATWLWVNILLPIFTGIGMQWAALMVGMQWVWDNILHPVWIAIQTALNWLYYNIWVPIMAGFKMEWQMFADALNWVWLNIIKPAWDAVAGGLGWLRDRFAEGVGWIGQLWAGLKALLARPINFMIDTVWNHGVVPAWNAVAGLVGLGLIGPLGLIPEAAGGGVPGEMGGTKPGGGGLLRGPGSGTSDSILGIDPRSGLATAWVSDREYVMPEKVSTAHRPFLDALRAGQPEAVQAAGGRGARLRRYAGGGIIAAQQFGARESGKPYIWGGVGPAGYDCSGFVSALINTARGQYPHRRLGVAAGVPWGGMAGGLGGGFSVGASREHTAATVGGVNAESGGRHNNVAFGGPAVGADSGQFPVKAFLPEFGGRFVSGGAGDGGGGGGFFNWILDQARKAFDDFTNPAIDALRAFVGEPPPQWRAAAPALAVKARDTVRDFVLGKADAAGGGAMGPAGAGAPFIVGQIGDAARGSGVGRDGAIIGTATGLVESNLTNLAGGDRDSVGVFQQRPSQGWGSIAECMNVLHAAYSFFRRFPPRWRSMVPGDVAQSVQRSAFPGKYQQRMGQAAGLVGQFGGAFDSGGSAIGRGIMLKDVIQPEQVLDPQETRDGYRPLVTVARDLESGRLSPPQGTSQQQINSMLDSRSAPVFPDEFRLSEDTRLQLDGDGLLRIIDGRLLAVADQITDGRTD